MRYQSTKIQIILILLTALFLFGCGNEVEYPIIPEIGFVDFQKINNGTQIDDKGVLIISFTDGDGDIGLNDADTTGIHSLDSQYYYNFFINFYEKQNGKYVKIESSLPFHSRIPYLTEEGVERSISGEVEMEVYINNFTSTYDTIAFETYIVDRQLHHSNTIKTPDIVVNK